MKRNKLVCFIIGSLFCFTLFGRSSTYGYVEELKGEAKAGSIKLSLDDDVSKTAILKTGKASLLKVSIPSENVTLILGPHTELKLRGYISGQDEFSSRHVLKNGMCRVNAFKKRGSHNPLLIIRGVSASVSVKKGEVIIMSTEAFRETELVVLVGDAIFNSKTRETGDELGVYVKEREWFGIGGRFGQKVGERMRLSRKLFSHYNYFK